MKKLAKALREIRRKSEPTSISATAAAAANDARPDKLTVATDTADAEVEDCDSGLEQLPAEVRRHILSVVDLHGLNALVRASPTFHRQYLLDRRYLLSAALHVTLGSVSLDAFISKKAMNPEEGPHGYITELLEMWQKRLPHSSSFRLDGVITEAEVVDMTAFYFQTVFPVGKHYMKRALTELRNQIAQGSDKSTSHPEPTKIEWQRCLRATYRFQLLCCATRPGPEPGLGREVAASHATHLFYAPEPWEAEELYAFYQFAEGVYDDIFDDIEVEVHPDNPRFNNELETRPPTPDGAFEFNNTFFRRNYREGTTLRGGLDLLQIVLTSLKPNDRETLVSRMQRSIVSSYIPLNTSAGSILSEDRQEERRQEAPSQKDKLTAERASLPFQADCLSGPPLAWTTIWAGTYSNLIGMYVPDEMRQWGYIFWDADRLEKHGGMDVLTTQWEGRWDEDPRENIY